MSAGRLNGPGVLQFLAGSGVRGRSSIPQIRKKYRCGHHSAYPVRVTPASRDIRSSLSHSLHKGFGSEVRSGNACAGMYLGFANCGWKGALRIAALVRKRCRRRLVASPTQWSTRFDSLNPCKPDEPRGGILSSFAYAPLTGGQWRGSPRGSPVLASGLSTLLRARPPD